MQVRIGNINYTYQHCHDNNRHTIDDHTYNRRYHYHSAPGQR